MRKKKIKNIINHSFIHSLTSQIQIKGTALSNYSSKICSILSILNTVKGTLEPN